MKKDEIERTPKSFCTQEVLSIREKQNKKCFVNTKRKKKKKNKKNKKRKEEIVISTKNVIKQKTVV